MSGCVIREEYKDSRWECDQPVGLTLSVGEFRRSGIRAIRRNPGRHKGRDYAHDRNCRDDTDNEETLRNTRHSNNSQCFVICHLISRCT